MDAKIAYSSVFRCWMWACLICVLGHLVVISVQTVCVCVCVCVCARACRLLEDRDAAGTQLMLFIPPGSLFLSNPESQACQRGGCLCWGKKLSAVLHPLSPHCKCQCIWKGWRRESSVFPEALKQPWDKDPPVDGHSPTILAMQGWIFPRAIILGLQRSMPGDV